MTRAPEEIEAAQTLFNTYRPPRVPAREAFGVGAAAAVIQGRPYAIVDLSMNGIAIAVERGEDVPGPVDAWVEVAVTVHGRPAHAGRARVARVEIRSDGARVGLQLMGGFLDLPRIRSAFQEEALRLSLTGGPEAVRALVPPRYREIVERAVHLVGFYRDLVERHERRYAEAGEDGPALGEALALRVLERMRPEWNAIRREGSEALADVIRDGIRNPVVRAAKAYTETVLTPLIAESPLVSRAWKKPLGYPGDYQTILYITQNRLVGPTAFARIFHKLACEIELGDGVRARKDLIRDWYLAHHAEFRHREPAPGAVFRVLNVGSGPVLELVDLTSEPGIQDHPFCWTLMDQEERALSLAYNEIWPRVAASGNGRLNCQHISFLQFMRDPEPFLGGAPQHFIYSSGLFDYLSTRRAQAMIQSLYDHLAPGGVLAICNALWPNLHYWLVELVGDWTLLYRTREEMLNLADRLPPAAEREVVCEASGTYWFLRVRKP